MPRTQKDLLAHVEAVHAKKHSTPPAAPTPGPCECKIAHRHPASHIVYCPLHAAAPELQDACIDAANFIDALIRGGFATKTGPSVLATLQAAIAAAESQKGA